MSPEPRNWDERYRLNDTPWETGHPSTELERIVREDKITPSAALELGCGTGANAVWLAEEGFTVTAIDISPLAIERARARANAPKVHVKFIVGDVLQDPGVGGPFDFFFDRGCYHVVRTIDVEAYVGLLRRAIAPGGRGLVLAGNARLPRTGPPIVSETEIRAELGQLFSIERLREITFDLAPGDGKHLGWSCLLRRPR
jgi:SAM-dependent methyltransferase